MRIVLYPRISQIKTSLVELNLQLIVVLKFSLVIRLNISSYSIRIILYLQPLYLVVISITLLTILVIFTYRDLIYLYLITSIIIDITIIIQYIPEQLIYRNSNVAINRQIILLLIIIIILLILQVTEVSIYTQQYQQQLLRQTAIQR